MGAAEAKKGEAIELHGAVSAQRLPDARLKVVPIVGYVPQKYINNDVDPMPSGPEI